MYFPRENLSDQEREDLWDSILKNCQLPFDNQLVIDLGENISWTRYVADKETEFTFRTAKKIAKYLIKKNDNNDRELDLSDSWVSIKDQGFVSIFNMMISGGHSFHIVNIRKNECADKGAFALATLLENDNKIQKISVKGNMIGPEGGQKLFESLTRNTMVQHIEVRGMYIKNGFYTI